MSSRIIDRVDLSGPAGGILLYDWMSDAGKDGRNLVRVDPEGGVLWRAAPPTTDMRDCFTAIRWDGQALTASTWSGYRVSVELQNGSVTVLEFTK